MLANTVAITGTVLGILALGTLLLGWLHFTPIVLMMSGGLLIAGGALGAIAIGRNR
jgi:hypothetical protein